MTRNIFIRLAAVLIAASAARLHAQIIDNTTPYSFTTSQSAINILAGPTLFTGDYDHTDGGANNDWVLSPGDEGGGGPELGYATSSAQWLTGGPVPFGTSIGAGGSYGGNLPTSDSSFTDAYYGLAFTISTGNVEYGWAELSYDSSTGTDTIVAAALDTTANDAIQAGAVPEPATYATFGLGVATLLIARRKQLAVRL